VTLTILMIFAAGLAARLAFLDRIHDRRDIFDLAQVLIAFQDNRISEHRALQHVGPFRDLIPEFLRNLAKGREADRDARNGSLRLPLGCRLGLLHFSPLLQLAMLLGLQEMSSGFDGNYPWRIYSFQPLPATRQAILEYLEKSCGWTNQIGLAVERRFGHTLFEYADYLWRLRKTDQVLFVLLMAREFGLAKAHVESGQRDEDEKWLRRSARIAEVQRCAEMMTYLKGRKLIKVARIRQALHAMVFRKRPSQRTRAVEHFGDCIPTILRLQSSVEAVRAMFVGSGALLASNPAIRYLSWASIPNRMKREAAASSELFSRFRTSRHCGARRDLLIDMYFGIPLDAVACVAIYELTVGIAKSDGADDCALIAQCMADQLMTPHRAKGYNRLQRRAPILCDAYLRRVGKLGCGGRFDHRLQFSPETDTPLYGRLAQIATGRPTSADPSSVRHLIGSIAHGLAKAKSRLGSLTDIMLSARVLCHLFSSLNQATMDPIFASLLDRAMTERSIPANSRTNPWSNSNARQSLIQFLRTSFRGVRERFARFEDLGGRPNHDKGDQGRPAPQHRPLTVQVSPPRVDGPGHLC
jgi:hypothetical protein